MRIRHVVGFLLVAGCSGSSGVGLFSDTSNNTPDPGGRAPDQPAPADDGGVLVDADVPRDATPDVVEPPPQAPTLLQAVSDVTVDGVTANGDVIYRDNTAKTLLAVSISGGAPLTILTGTDRLRVTISGSVVFVWNAVNATTNIGALTVWTRAAGPKSASPAAIAGVAAASTDGDRIMFTRSAAGNSAVLAGANSDASDAVGIGAITLGCTPSVGFGGSRFVASYCTGQNTNATVSTYDRATLAKTELATNAVASWAIDRAGSKVFAITATREARVYAPTGGAPTKIDDGVGFGLLYGTGAAIVYRANGALKRSATSAPAPVELVPSGANALWGISSDDRFVLYSSSTGQLRDLYLASTSVPGAPVPLVETNTGASYGDDFTADGSHVLYFSAVDVTAYTGTLNAKPVSGGPAVVLGKKAWIARAATRTKVVFTDGVENPAPGARRAGDLRIVDTAGASAASLIAEGTDVDFFLTADGRKVVYTTKNADAAKSGVFVAGVP